MTRQEAIEIGKIMIKSYEKRGGGHHQKLALQILLQEPKIDEEKVEEIIRKQWRLDFDKEDLGARALFKNIAEAIANSKEILK